MMRTLLILSLLLAPAWVWADEFDITMDVVGAEESFDEVIVNRIALPFAPASGRHPDAPPRLESDAASLSELNHLVDDGLYSTDQERGADMPRIDADTLPLGGDSMSVVLPSL